MVVRVSSEDLKWLELLDWSRIVDIQFDSIQFNTQVKERLGLGHLTLTG